MQGVAVAGTRARESSPGAKEEGGGEDAGCGEGTSDGDFEVDLSRVQVKRACESPIMAFTRAVRKIDING